MKRSNHLDLRVGAMPSAPATHKPSQSTVSRPLRVSVRIAERSATVTPIFTHRTHYGAPKARGHRQWMGEKR